MPEKHRSVLNPRVLERMRIPDMILSISHKFAEHVENVTHDLDISYWHDLNPKQDFDSCRKYLHEIHCVATKYAQLLKAASRELQQLALQSRISDDTLKEKNLELIKTENDLFRLRSLLTKVHYDKIAVDIAFPDKYRPPKLSMSRAVHEKFLHYIRSGLTDRSLHEEDCRCNGEGSKSTRKTIEIAYGAPPLTNRTFGNWHAWCPIVKEFVYRNHTRLRLIPVMTEQNEIDLGYLLGLGNNPTALWAAFRGPSSAVFLSRYIAQAIQTFQAVLIPTDDDGPDNYQFVILDESVRETQMTLFTPKDSYSTIGSWDRRKLEWFNDHRPSVDNMYYRYLVTRILRKRYRANGWEEDAEKVRFGQTWSVRTQLRCDVMYQIATELGDLSDEPSDTTQSSIVLERPNMLKDDGGNSPSEEALNTAVRIVDCLNDALQQKWMHHDGELPEGLR